MLVEFTLLGESNNTKYTAISGEDGFVIMNVPAGTYTLKEEKAPNGYNASGAAWKVVVENDGTYITNQAKGIRRQPCEQGKKENITKNRLWK